MEFSRANCAICARVERSAGSQGFNKCATFELTRPAAKAQEQAISMVAPGGKVSFFGGLPKDAPYIQCDANIVHYKEVTLYGANGSSPQQNLDALNLIASGKVHVADLITHKVALDHVQDAIDAVLSGDAIKVVVNP